MLAPVAAMAFPVGVSIVRGDDGGVAEQLFREGKALIGEGKIAEACRAFEGSYRKEPAISTLLNLADCQEKNGQLASAWASFVEADRATRADQADAALHDVAAARAAKLEPRLSYLQIDVAPAAGVAGLEILRNDVVLDRAEWGTRIAVDGGQYVIVARAPGYEAWSTTVGVGAERDWRTIAVPTLNDARPAGGRPGVPRPSPRGTRGAWTMIAGGGLIAASLVPGYLAKSKFQDAKTLCGEDLRCDDASDRARGQDLVDGARWRGNVATAVAAAGVVTAGVGLWLWLGSRHHTRPADTSAARIDLAPRLATGSTSLVLEGTW
ncbi:MAG TPA: hypothetical protein VHE35_22905 [Kofleriaceae bacterium]|nr:hypothetical protein [Kofleriaceae bacterium]